MTLQSPAPSPQPEGEPAGRPLWWGFLAGVLLLGGLIYGPARHFGFLNLDDELFVRDNPWLAMGWQWKSLRWAFLANLTEYSNHAEYWSPLTLLTRLADAQIYGLQAGPFHVTNVLFHLLNTVLLALALRRFTGHGARSYLVALLFLVHPLNVETVCWLSARKDLVNATFFLCTLLAYGWYAGTPTARRYAVVLVAYLACLMAKPMGVSVPFLLLLLDSWPLRRWPSGPECGRERIRLAAEKIPFLLLAVLAAALAVQSQQDWGAMEGAAGLPLLPRVENALISYTLYFRRLFWPHDLAIYYPHPGLSISGWQALWAGLELVAVTIASWLVRRRFPMALIGWLWFGLVLGPVIGLVQIGGQAMADRYAYLALIGPLVALVWGAAQVAASRRWRIAAATGAVAYGAVLAAHQTLTWRNNETVFTRALAVTQNNVTAHLNLGCDLIDAGRLPEAERHLRQAVEINPRSSLGWNDLARAQALQGHDRDAISSYAHALQINPDNQQSLLFVGRLLKKAGDAPRAEAVFLHLAKIAPEIPQPFSELAQIYSARGQWPEAAQNWRAYLGFHRDDLEAQKQLAEASAKLGPSP